MECMECVRPTDVDTFTLPVTAEGILCYKCYASQPGHMETDLLCSQFDGSTRFHVLCPSSTLCRKRTIYSNFNSIVVKTEERDCTFQKRSEPIYHEDYGWQNKEEIVSSDYKQGCFIGEDRGGPGGPSEYCFCGHPLCNASHSMKITNVHNIFILTVSSLTIFFKYLF
ncbi:uncharacterized protein LOC108627630 isoform X2 [Ceratina calcarata]|uniref:Uncharacterized protein LOC108627630 isoform X2 n=1 Tax=Ceratina calcarata TaxID=156304 RepID=A0AAJ7S6N3_9HYME|nr:uncharacterized protein LOC108627630 isoform X2 [Ceratina calcarata]